MDLQARTMCYLLIYVFLFTLLLKEGLSITCYSCNSDYIHNCENLKYLPEDERLKYTINCDHLKPVYNGSKYTMCRIISQNINGDERTIRQCATHGTPGECYSRTGTHRIKMEYCECTTDLCNTGYSWNTNWCTSLVLILSFGLFLSLLSV